MNADQFREIALQTNSVDSFIQMLRENTEKLKLPAYVSELAAMEGHIFKLANRLISVKPYSEGHIINPDLSVFSNTWKHLAGILIGATHGCQPVKEDEQVMVWPSPNENKPMSRAITSEDLLVMKMTMENLSSKQVAEQTDTNIAAVNGAVLQALDSGIIWGPKSKIIRAHSLETRSVSNKNKTVSKAFGTSRVFALQWHITQACDLNCRHCYDRTPTEPLTLSREIAILDSLYDFCNTHNLFGQVSFTGGNPLLHPNFHRLYKEASDRGFFIGILGNPTSRDEIESLIAIQQPSFYQVSLEGLKKHNDYIRGTGHFQRILAFLKILKQTGIYSKIMLTLTRDNLDQVIPLGEFLKDRIDLYTFNRLSLMGEGANLIMADPSKYSRFLEQYMNAAQSHKTFDLKDNLFNILLHKNQSTLFGGCTGYGCGAAFNFVSILATGEVHACRKFPSPIGDICKQSLTEIYHSKIADRYRKGAEECSSCQLNLVCRGCMASAHSYGLDVFKKKDPYCFI
ncbi:MAG: selenobiotic family peptide radical SAM maturase [Deltaproteobacteria bacterium]|uniref:thio(seleno)oxazole modification radical SAM maturase SbtM n=1 Tax=Desulfobacula sp. TaxID=2593537 RepID=UPI001998EEEB|nr:selenobiotic family peptide radical SAM maturase [Candidatus Desulfobacula maris]MBL6995839.1 selenobiotic family peptide radical SAM maturase [Desulfobacula sp.]